MASRVEISDDWEENVLAAWGDFADTRLGPEIAGDAARYAPKRSGSLAASVEHHMEGDALIVSATGGDDEREYAAYVELGHRVFHPSTGITGPEIVEAEPFLRPALYKERGDE